ncbi:MAG: ABC transporter substrate-binding protein [Burkholderiaceae bacterium]|nr:ABC transporter substrate-binding protein [Burkholderiaceae bacterium]
MLHPVSRRRLSALCLALLSFCLAPSTQAADAPLRVGVPVWVGWMPWWVAKEKGLFSRRGVAVDLRNFAVQGDAVTALAGGSLDAASLATNDVLTINAVSPKATVVMLHDESAGADMLITRGIDTPLALKGQRIALEVGGVSHFFLNKLLAKYGMSEKDVTVVNMAAPDAGAAFTGKSINAAVTWEPFGTQGVKSGGKLLLTSKDTPGAIVDVLSVRNEVLKNRPEQVRRMVAAWFDALDYVKKHQAEAFKIMAKASGVSVGEFGEMWKGVRIPSLADNRLALGSPGKSGTYGPIVGEMGQFMVTQKLLSKPVSPETMVTGEFLPTK